MTRTLMTLAVVGAAGVLSICDLCPPGARSVAALLPAAHAAVVGRAAARNPIAATAPSVDRKIATFHVEGMTCGGCVIGVRKVLTRLGGVERAEVSYERQRAVVTYDPAKVTIVQMIAAIRTLGYKASIVSAEK